MIYSLHHYFPALYFAIIAFTLIVDVYAKKLGKLLHTLILSLLIIVNVAVFLYFMPFAFGFTGPAKEYDGRKWYSNWRIHDGGDDE